MFGAWPEPFRSSRFIVGSILACAAVSGCQSTKPAVTALPESPEACEARKRRFVHFLGTLPDRSVAATVHVDLPRTTVGRAPGSGAVLEVSASGIVLEGEAPEERQSGDAAARVARWLETRVADAPGGQPLLYIAAAAEIEIGVLRGYLAKIPESVELRLLVHTDAGAPPADRAKGEAVTIAHELLAEQDPGKRSALSAGAYASFSNCAAFDDAVRASTGAWPARRAALVESAAKCRCSELDTDSLQRIASAEQRAGAAGLGYVPAGFLRDQRCSASMPRRSVGKLVKQMEAFDAEFAGSFQKDAVEFEDVLTNERLLNYFCNALPGETLAAEQRARATLYWKLPGTSACQAWRFEPLAPGAPMGTWRRVAAPGLPPLAFHYWQAAEEIRLFGPVPEGSASKPTDQQDWQCKQDYKLIAVDSRSVQTETGRWFTDEAACRAAAEEPSTESCVTALATAAPRG